MRNEKALCSTKITVECTECKWSGKKSELILKGNGSSFSEVCPNCKK